MENLDSIKSHNDPKIEPQSGNIADSKGAGLTPEALNQVKESIKPTLDAEIRTLQKDFLIFFGLFASFMTFLSIEVQVFKNRESLCEFGGISAISLSFVLLFALVLNDIVKDKNWASTQKWTYCVCLIFLVIGAGLLWWGSFSSKSRIDQVENQIKRDSIRMRHDSISIDSLKRNVKTLDSLNKRLMETISPIEKKIKTLDSLSRKL